MNFTDLNFLLRFLPVFIFIYYLVPGRYRCFALLAGSIICYGIGDAKRLLLLLILTAANYIFISMLAKNRRKSVLLAGIFIDAGTLIFFKYFSDNMPLGVSFYTFMMIAALADVYRQDVRHESVIEYFSYIFMFPKMIQGPVIPLKDIKDSIRKPDISVSGLVEGIEYFAVGMGLKVIIADEIGKLWNSITAIGFESVSTPLAWLGVMAFSMQLYFDFWGYSVMAKGLGKMLGIPIMRNFNHPYAAVSVSEYYRRWHISLGRWFKDYLYIPLGGNRKGKRRHILNLFAVWLFTGIWHGTSVNFLIWAGVLFVLIVLEKFVYGELLERHRLAGHVYIWVLIPMTWAVFATENIKDLGIFFSRLIPIGHPDALMAADMLHYAPAYIWVVIVGFLVSLPAAERFFEKNKESTRMYVAVFALLWICIWLAASGSCNAFMYARF